LWKHFGKFQRACTNFCVNGRITTALSSRR
jgi:hypothetical protein